MFLITILFSTSRLFGGKEKCALFALLSFVVHFSFTLFFLTFGTSRARTASRTRFRFRSGLGPRPRLRPGPRPRPGFGPGPKEKLLINY
jgi:hypothetical protein